LSAVRDCLFNTFVATVHIGRLGSAHNHTFFFFGGATARGGPWAPLQYASKPLDPLLYLSIRLFPSFSDPWTRSPSSSSGIHYVPRLIIRLRNN